MTKRRFMTLRSSSSTWLVTALLLLLLLVVLSTSAQPQERAVASTGPPPNEQHDETSLAFWKQLLLKSPPGKDTNDNSSNNTIIHPLWLRERCRESFYADANTFQPKYNLHEEVEDLVVQDVELTNASANSSSLCITFSDQRTCHYKTDDLWTDWQGQTPHFWQVPTWHIPVPLLWNATSLSAPRVFAHDDIRLAKESSAAEETTTTTTSTTLDFLETLLTVGVVVIADVPREPGECVRFGTQYSSLRETEWGTTFNVKVLPDGKMQDLAYSSNRIGMHVDNPYRVDTPPSFQLLHALEHCDARVRNNSNANATALPPCHVYNEFVDGFAVAQALWEHDPAMFDILTTTMLRWENNGGDNGSLLYRFAPMIELETDPTMSFQASSSSSSACPAVKSINFSAKSGGYVPGGVANSATMSYEQLDLFYRAKRTFSALLHAPEFAVHQQLFPGALVFFDNRRVLHSRSEIIETDGPRWLQGCYVNRDGIVYLYERLRRQQQQQQQLTTVQSQEPSEGSAAAPASLSANTCSGGMNCKEE